MKKTDNTNNSLSQVLSKGANRTPIMIAVLPIMSMLAVLILGVLRNVSGIDIAKLGIITLILTGAVTFYINLYMDDFLNKKYSKTVIVFGYLCSVFLLLVVPSPDLYSIWMLGGLVVAMLIDNKLGLLINFNMTFMMSILLGLRPELLIQILIICFLMSILAGGLKHKSTVIYSSIIILSTNITLSFVVNNFIFDKTSNYKYFDSLISMVAVLVAAFFLCVLYNRFFTQEDLVASTDSQEEPLISISPIDNEDLPMQAMETTRINSTTMDQNQFSLTSYEILCDVNNQLLLKLKEFSESLYTHSIYIGGLSSRAAKEIGADEQLTRAGGYYHEIGKMNGKNYIEEGLKLAEEYAFPKELKAILREHNIKYDRPNSVEAAIVMLSDNIVSTLDYIEKTKEHKFTPHTIIENIFQMRLDKGTFDFSGVSVKDYKKLKAFYQSEFSNGKEV